MIEGIKSSIKDIEERYTIADILGEICTDIEIWDVKNALIDKSNELTMVRSVVFFCILFSSLNSCHIMSLKHMSLKHRKSV